MMLSVTVLLYTDLSEISMDAEFFSNLYCAVVTDARKLISDRAGIEGANIESMMPFLGTSEMLTYQSKTSLEIGKVFLSS